MHLFLVYFKFNICSFKCMNPKESVWRTGIKRALIDQNAVVGLYCASMLCAYYLLSGFVFAGIQVQIGSAARKRTSIVWHKKAERQRKKSSSKIQLKCIMSLTEDINCFIGAAPPCCESMHSSEVKQDKHPVIDSKLLLLSQSVFGNESRENEKPTASEHQGEQD